MSLKAERQRWIVEQFPSHALRLLSHVVPIRILYLDDWWFFIGVLVFRCGGAADFPQQLYSSLPDGVPIRVHWAVMSRAIHGSLPDKLAETLCALKIQRIWGHFRRFLNSSFSLWPGFRDLCFITPLLDTITLRLLEQSRRLHLESHRFPFWEFRSRVYRDWGQFQGRLGRFCPRNLLLEGILLWEFGFSFDHLLGAQFILLNQP